MMSYLMRTVWPGVPTPRLQVLRSVLYGVPFKIRSPEELVKHAARLAHSVLDVVDEHLRRRGMGALADGERQAYLAFVEARCDPAASTFDSLSTPSAVYQPASKLRIVGECRRRRRVTATWASDGVVGVGRGRFVSGCHTVASRRWSVWVSGYVGTGC